MSWTATGRAENGEVEVSTDGQEWSAETTEQLQAGSKAIQAIIKSGALGDPDAAYYVSMTGHANTDHEPVAGWSNDHITISISQAGEAKR